MPSVAQLQELLKSEPDDSFLRYGLAMEYAKQGEHAAAMREFAWVLDKDPNYVAAYFMGGRTLEQQGDIPAAKAMYARGIETARRVGDTHAMSEISTALSMLE